MDEWLLQPTVQQALALLDRNLVYTGARPRDSVPRHMAIRLLDQGVPDLPALPNGGVGEIRLKRHVVCQ